MDHIRQHLSLVENLLLDWVISSANFIMPNFSNGKLIGNISVGALSKQLEVYQIISENEMGLAAVDPEIGLDSPLGYIGFNTMSNGAYISRNAFTIASARKKGIISELMKFMVKDLGNIVLSDTHMSYDGIALWKSLLSKPAIFDIKILYIPTSEQFSTSNVGKLTSDGTNIILPDNDNSSEDFYDPTTNIGQRFFYIINPTMKTTVEQKLKENKRAFGYPNTGIVGGLGLIQPMGIFVDGDL